MLIISKLVFKLGIVLLINILLSPCFKPANKEFGIFTVLDSNTVEIDGVIDKRTPQDFDEMIGKYPNVKIINMLNCPGSKNDEANLIVSKKIHDMGIGFHLFSTSSIASGAVDMFVGGVRRTKEPGAKIGVHSWRGRNGKTAMSYPVGDIVHQPYINYYRSIGFTEKEAEAFYYFTINAAPEQTIHWMTEKEIKQYGLLTE